MDRADVIILGGGLVGLALAAALDSSGLSSIVIDPADPEAHKDAAFDGRTSALSSSSKRMFDTIGIIDHFPVPGCPIRRIEVADGLGSGGLSFDPGEDDEPLGWMNENRHLRAALRGRAEAGKNIWLMWKAKPAQVEREEHGVTVRLEDGRVVAAPLLVAAEGRNSPMREAAGIRCARWKYDQDAIVSTLRHERPHENVAYEIFYPSGPFALLPMTDDEGGHRSAIVWSVKAEDAAGFLALDDADFAAEAEAAMGGFLGRIELLAPRSTYPLGFHHAARITDHRLALVGDAAHGIHPIHAQGFNLAVRDVAALAEVLIEAARARRDLGGPEALMRYDRLRRADARIVAGMTDGLNTLFSNDLAAVRVVRGLGLSALDRVAPLKHLVMRRGMGLSGALPRLARGEMP
jgi:2-octaprenyl-6-methoxyphenol hydroxylase